jgi:ribosomal protein S4
MKRLTFNKLGGYKMDKEEKARLEAQHKELREKTEKLYSKYLRIKKLYCNAYGNYYDSLEEFKRVDRELAMEDKLSKVTRTKRADIINKLTKEQIMAVLAELKGEE